MPLKPRSLLPRNVFRQEQHQSHAQSDALTPTRYNMASQMLHQPQIARINRLQMWWGTFLE